MPFLDELSRRTGEGTSLAVLRDGVVTIVAKRESEGPVRVVQEVGARRPIYCTAVGKALAAWLPDRELDGIIARTVFERKTPRTITTPAAFRRELARIRATGFAIDNEEHSRASAASPPPSGIIPARCAPRSASWGRQAGFRSGGCWNIRKVLAAVAADLSARLGYEAAAASEGEPERHRTR